MRDIKGYEGLYAATSCGKVWSFRRQKFLKPFDNGYGYLYVNLVDASGKKRCVKLHRIIAQTFIDNPENKPEVDHIDKNPYRNDINNLRWVSSKENKANTTFAGSKKCFSKVRCVETGVIYKNCADAARAIGANRYSINCVLLGKQKTSAGYHWERVFKDEK